MLELQRQRLLAKLQQLDYSLAKRPGSDAGAVERRIGRWLGRYPAAEKLLDVQIRRDARGHAAGLARTGIRNELGLRVHQEVIRVAHTKESRYFAHEPGSP